MRRRLWLFLYVLALASLSYETTACALHPAPPPGTYSVAGQKTYTADQFLKDLKAFSQTAINLNATPGREHLSDQDTRHIRDFALAANDGIYAWGQGKGPLDVVTDAFRTLRSQLSAEARASSGLQRWLAVIDTGLTNLAQ